MKKLLLDEQIKEQLKEYLKLLENDVLIKISVSNDKASLDTIELVNEIKKLSSKIKVLETKLDRTPSFSINRIDEETGVVFAGLPLGHEFTSLVLALLQVAGRPIKLSEEIVKRIKEIKEKLNFCTYVSLTCHNCPDVVQALNMMAIINPNITHTMIEGSVYQQEILDKDILAVPAVYLNGEPFANGRMTIEDILEKLGSKINLVDLNEKEVFDILVVGGGPAGASSSIYSARKGLKTGVIVKRLGGQILDTVGIENVIGTPYIEGNVLASQLVNHMKQYDIDIIQSLDVVKIEKENDLVNVYLENDAVLKTKALIIATGASWRNVGVLGEEEFKNKGVAYCPHCDGPLFKGKDVAVIGGGNSGIEAAIDLAGIVKHVTVLEFLPELKADLVLQDRIKKFDNITVIKNAQTKEITGTNKVNGLIYVDRSTKLEHNIDLSAVFVQIGLVPNTKFLDGIIEKNKLGEIIVDDHNKTSLDGVFAAGDCTNAPYKQIIISMGSGANAALSAYEYLISLK